MQHVIASLSSLLHVTERKLNQLEHKVGLRNRIETSASSSLNPISFFSSQVQILSPSLSRSRLLLTLLSIHFQFSTHKPKVSLPYCFNFQFQLTSEWLPWLSLNINMSFCLFEICFWIYGFLFWFWWFRRVHKMCSIKCYCEFSSTLASPPGLMLFFFLFVSFSINLIICFYIENESFYWRNQRCRRFKGDVDGRIIEQTNLGCLYAIMMSNIDFSFATSCCV